jgi:vacuolar-type H+-ATPase subunit F/Vma7
MSKLRVVAVGQYPLISGFALAGVTTMETASDAEGIVRLTELIGRDDVGVVLADRAVIAGLSEPTQRRLSRQSLPIVLPLPRPDWDATSTEGEGQILDLLQRAIGYRVRLQ